MATVDFALIRPFCKMAAIHYNKKYLSFSISLYVFHCRGNQCYL